MAGRTVLVKVPASTANLGPGFDTLGMALSLFSWIEMTEGDGETVITLHGYGLEKIPTNKYNLVYKVAQLVFKEAGIEVPELKITMYSDIPLTRGLGSSASAIVGALLAANALIGSPLSQDKLFQMATALEGHPDNVGASLWGGIVVAAWDGQQADYVRIDSPAELEVLVAVPRFQLSTEKARNALPKQIDMNDAIFNVSRSSLLVAALASGQLELIASAVQDRLHQPYRMELVPGMQTILDGAVAHGALGAVLSGAGPTLLAFSSKGNPRADELEHFMIEAFAAEGITADTSWLKPYNSGPVVRELTPNEADVPFMERIKGDLQV